MSTAIATLMDEHRQIEAALDRLDELVAERDGAPSRARIAELTQFFTEFADRHHHGKEEAVLFELMVEAGLPRNGGPIGCMLQEHDEGRALVARMSAIGGGDGPLAAAEREDLADAAARFSPLLRAHIQKEDQVLYPMAERTLDASALAVLDARCAAIEDECAADGSRRRLDALVASATR